MKKLTIIGLIMLLSACAKTPNLDYDQSADFSNIKNYAWVADLDFAKDTDNYQVNPLMEQRVTNAIDSALSSKGLNKVNKQNADVVINIHASVKTKTTSDSFTTSFGHPWHTWGLGINTHTQTKEYEYGTLIVDIIDAKSDKLIWRGAKEGLLKKYHAPEKRTRAVNNLVNQILNHFPPTP